MVGKFIWLGVRVWLFKTVVQKVAGSVKARATLKDTARRSVDAAVEAKK